MKSCLEKESSFDLHGPWETTRCNNDVRPLWKWTSWEWALWGWRGGELWFSQVENCGFLSGRRVHKEQHNHIEGGRQSISKKGPFITISVIIHKHPMLQAHFWVRSSRSCMYVTAHHRVKASSDKNKIFFFLMWNYWCLEGKGRNNRNAWWCPLKRKATWKKVQFAPFWEPRTDAMQLGPDRSRVGNH